MNIYHFDKQKVSFGDKEIYVSKAAFIYNALIEYRVNNKRYQVVMPIPLSKKLPVQIWQKCPPQKFMDFNPLMFARHLLRMNGIQASRCRILEILGAEDESTNSK